MIDKIRIKTTGFQLLLCEIFSQLMNNGTNNLQMSQFFGACRGWAMEERVPNPCAARVWGVEQGQNGECAKTVVAV